MAYLYARAPRLRGAIVRPLTAIMIVVLATVALYLRAQVADLTRDRDEHEEAARACHAWVNGHD